MNARLDAKILIARQCAIASEQVWDRLSEKTRIHYMTLAENILATVERKAQVKW